MSIAFAVIFSFSLLVLVLFTVSLASLGYDNKRNPRYVSIARFRMYQEFKDTYITSMIISFLLPLFISLSDMPPLMGFKQVLYSVLFFVITVYYALDIYILYRGYLFTRRK